MKRFLPGVLAAVLLLAGCASPSAPAANSTPPPSPPRSEAEHSAPVAPPEPEPDPYPDPRQEAIDRILSSMTDEEKVGQLFFARCPAWNGANFAAEYHLGGYLLFSRDFKDKTIRQVQEDIAAYQEAATLPLLIGVDEEGGTVVRVSSNPQLRNRRFASPQELYRQGGLDAILADCQEKDTLLSSLGINVNFAPVADLSTNSGDFIYDRTLGLGTEETCEYIAAVVSQMEKDGIGSVLKHFPGYGPNKDTHTGSALDTRPLDQLRQADLLPFKSGAEASQGNTAILVSHNIIQELDPDVPGSLSPAMYHLLREETGFTGPALTDDLAMDAISRYSGAESPAVLALKAGCDMVVTTDFQAQIPQVLDALKNGTLSQERVEEAATRVLGWKYDLGLLH